MKSIVLLGHTEVKKKIQANTMDDLSALEPKKYPNDYVISWIYDLEIVGDQAKKLKHIKGNLPLPDLCIPRHNASFLSRCKRVLKYREMKFVL